MSAFQIPRLPSSNPTVESQRPAVAKPNGKLGELSKAKPPTTAGIAAALTRSEAKKDKSRHCRQQRRPPAHPCGSRSSSSRCRPTATRSPSSRKKQSATRRCLRNLSTVTTRRPSPFGTNGHGPTSCRQASGCGPRLTRSRPIRARSPQRRSDRR